MTTDIALIGPPGSGKGTQAKPLAAEHELVHIATGDLLRTAVTDGSPAGRAAKRFMDAGELVPDELVLGLLVAAIERRTAARGLSSTAFPAPRHKPRHWTPNSRSSDGLPSGPSCWTFPTKC